MSKVTKVKLSYALRRIAREVYDNSFKGKAGICWELNPYNAERLIMSASSELYTAACVYMIDHVKWSGFLCREGRQWEQRAMFCLLLAEMIEQEK